MRGGGGRRWIAVSGGLLINGLILTALVLVEAPAPIVEEPTFLVELERPQPRKAPARRAKVVVSGASAAARPSAAPSPAVAGGAERPPVDEGQPAPVIAPEWRVDPKAVERWRLQEGNPALGMGRYARACSGLSSEHMTDEEKDRCYGGWRGAPRDKRPSPDFVGPIDERKWEVYRPDPKLPSAYDRDVERRQRCRDYRRSRTPTYGERNLVTGAPPPSLRERGCF